MKKKIEVLSNVARVIGELACTMRKDAIDKLMNKDLPLQDYLANEVSGDCPEDPLECLEYAGTVLEYLQDMQNHIEKGEKLNISDEEREIMDILVGDAPNDYPSDYILMSKAVVEMVTKRLEGCNHVTMTSKKAGEFVADILQDVKKMANDRDINLFRVAYAEPLANLSEWLWFRLHERANVKG